MAWSDEQRMRESDADALNRRNGQEAGAQNTEDAESLLRDRLRTLEDASAADEPAIIAASSALGRLLVDRGAFDDAESVLTRALALSEAASAPQDAELPILLRELSRLYILQAAHDRAERPLVRLLAITEAQGEHRPVVATVLASLAAVRHALGDYASAEQLYRRALNIRETTLAPNHVTVATTMESLAETCAARGRFVEAISLCKRAVVIRETTLGANDGSVRVVRQRITDLQLEAHEEIRDTPPRSAPVVQSSPPIEPTHIESPHIEPPHIEPPRIEPSQIEPPLMERAPTVDAPRPAAVFAPWVAELAAVREEIESTSIAVRNDRTPRRTPLATAVETRSATKIAVAAAVVVVLAALGFKSQLGDKPEPGTFVLAEPLNPAARPEARPVAAAAVPPVATPAPVDTPAIIARPEVVVAKPKPVVARPTAPAVQARELPRPEALPPSAPVASPPAVVRSEPTNLPTSNAPASNAATSNAPSSPTLIGPAPQPQYPDALRELGVEGEVVVQFVVEENGRPDVSSMTVVRSPHALLTNAARAVLPQFRYEPARTAPPQSIPRPETVRYTFTFRVPR